MADVVVLFALAREAKPFRKLSPDACVIISGVGLERARIAAETAIAEYRPKRIVMAGFCGALKPNFKVGDVIAPAEVIDQSGGRWLCSNGHGRLLTTGCMIGDPAEKAALALRYDADIVDMESAAVAEVCRRLAVPFTAVRAVSDAAETRLSLRLLTLLDGGNVSPCRAMTALLRQPSLLSEFWRLARNTRLAADALARHL